MRARSLPLWLLALVPCLASAAPIARADDPKPEEKPADEPKPADDPKPADEPKKPAKPTTDDTSIFKDYNLAKARGIGHHKERARFWEEKGVKGKDLFWLGRLWQKGEDWPKAVEAFDKYFAWDPATDPAVDPKDKEKWIADRQKNSEVARKELMEIHLRNKDHAKVIEAAAKYRELYPNGGAVSESWVQQGRAQRLEGDVDAAVVSFKTASDLGFAKGLLDMVELLMAEGRYPEAKAAADKAAAGDLGKNPVVKAMAAFATAANGGGPAFDALVFVGRGEAPVTKDKVVLFYHWHMQVSGVDRKWFAMDRDVQQPAGTEKALVAGLATFHHYNPETSKLEDGMSGEQEVDWYKKFTDRFDMRNVFVAPKEFLEAMQLKYEGQMVILDADGKLRWMRIGKDEPYDRAAAAAALKKVAEKPK